MKKHFLLIIVLFMAVACSDDENHSVSADISSFNDVYSSQSVENICTDSGGVFDSNSSACTLDNSSISKEDLCISSGGVFFDGTCEYKVISMPCSRDNKTCQFIDNGTFTPCANCLNGFPCLNAESCSQHKMHYDNSTHGGFCSNHNGYQHGFGQGGGFGHGGGHSGGHR